MMLNFFSFSDKELIGSFFAKLLKNGFHRILPFTGELDFMDSSDWDVNVIGPCVCIWTLCANMLWDSDDRTASASSQGTYLNALRASGSHSCIWEDLNTLGCDSVSFGGEFSTFRRAFRYVGNCGRRLCSCGRYHQGISGPFFPRTKMNLHEGSISPVRMSTRFTCFSHVS